MASPTFSIIIPAHNEEKYLEKTLEALHQQSRQDFEVIVVTNGCTDQTREIAERYSKLPVKMLNLPLANVSRARNYGASKSQGAILVFLDADTLLGQNAIENINSHFMQHHSVASTRTRADLPGARYALLSLFKNTCFITRLYKGCSGVLICRRGDFDVVQGYDSELAVREHHKLISKLQHHGKYTCLSTTSTTSMRRMQCWGLSKTAWFWIQQWYNDKFRSLEKAEYEKIR